MRTLLYKGKWKIILFLILLTSTISAASATITWYDCYGGVCEYDVDVLSTITDASTQATLTGVTISCGLTPRTSTSGSGYGTLIGLLTDGGSRQTFPCYFSKSGYVTAEKWYEIEYLEGEDIIKGDDQVHHDYLYSIVSLTPEPTPPPSCDTCPPTTCNLNIKVSYVCDYPIYGDYHCHPEEFNCANLRYCHTDGNAYYGKCSGSDCTIDTNNKIQDCTSYCSINNYYEINNPTCSGGACQFKAPIDCASQRYCGADNNVYSGQCGVNGCGISQTKIQDCVFGCNNGACNPDPCQGITCPARCNVNGDVETGTCVAGQCQYTVTNTCDPYCDATGEYAEGTCVSGACTYGPPTACLGKCNGAYCATMWHFLIDVTAETTKITNFNGAVTSEDESGDVLPACEYDNGNSWWKCLVYANENFRITGTTQHFDPGYSTNPPGWTLISTMPTTPVPLALTRHVNTVDVTTNVNANVDFMYEGEGYQDCTGDGTTTHVCSIQSGRNFRIKASAANHNDAYEPSDTGWNLITQDMPYTINLVLTQLEISGTVSPIDSSVTYNYTAGLPISCNPPGDGTYSCIVDSGVPFTLMSSRTGYVQFYKDYLNGIGPGPETQNIELTPTLNISFDNNSPIRGTVTATSGLPQYTQQVIMNQGVYTNGYLLMNLDPAGTDYTITYTDATGRHFDEDGGIITLINDSEQARITLSIGEVTYALETTLNDEDNNNLPIIDGTVIAEFDGSDHTCPFMNNIYNCSIPHNTQFNIKGSKNGYVTDYLFTNPQTLTSEPQPGNQLAIKRTLRIGIVGDDLLPVNTGAIYVNNQADTINIATIDLSGNSETEFYVTVPPQTINVYYSDGLEYNPYEKTNVLIPANPTSQILVSLGPENTSPTNIRAYTPTGTLSRDDFTIKIDGVIPEDMNCEIINGQISCALNQYTHEARFNKTGYLTRTVNVPANNNGLEVNATMNQTLMVNVTDQNQSPASGTIKIINNSGVEIASASLNNGVAWIPINPEDNTQALTIKFESNDFTTVTNQLNAGTINDQQTTFKSLSTHTMTSLTIEVKDHYTQLDLTEFNVKSWNEDTIYCTTNPCRFDMENPPTKTNFTISIDEGYFNQTIVDQSISVGTLTVHIKPRAVIYLNTKGNATIINTKKTSSELDDTIIKTVESNDDGVTSITIEADIEFMLELNATNHLTKRIGPFTTNDEDTLVIGSSSSPEELIPLSDFVPPVVTSMTYTPQNPTQNDDITVTIQATDADGGENTVQLCKYSIDDNPGFTNIAGNYDDYTVTVSKNIGQLSNGVHTIKFQCSDVDGWSYNDHVLSITVGESQDDDDDDGGGDDDDDDDTPTPPPTSNAIRLNSLKNKYSILVKSGIATQEIIQAVNNAEEKISTGEASQALSDAESIIPNITLTGGGSVRTVSNQYPELVAQQIALIERQPYTLTELKNSLFKTAFSKSMSGYIINGQEKTIITLRVFSREDNPDAVIADFNPGASNAPNTVTTTEGSITYFKGLNAGENVFEYVIDGQFSETTEPISFTMKELSGTEKTFKGITGFTIGIPGVLEVPVVYVASGAIILFLILKFLI